MTTVSNTTINPTLAQILWPSEHAALRNVLLMVAGTLALWASAKIQVPFYPVPITMQTFVVLVIGMAYGWKLGAATVLLYLAEGAFGLPVFAGTPHKGIGLAYMAGPTGGYLLGFFASVLVVGWLANKGWDRSFLKTLFAMIFGTAVIFAFGIFWLGVVIGWDKPVFEFGLYPFLYGEAFKIGLATTCLPLIWRGLNCR